MPDTTQGLRHVEHVMGTVFSFDIRDHPTQAIQQALAEAVAMPHTVDAVFSTYRPDSAVLHEAGARNTCVNGGGDVQLRGRPAPGLPWRIGIAHPFRSGQLAASVTADGELAVATSGTVERGAHILDPHRGVPARGLASVMVTGPRLTMTDAYATAAFAQGASCRDWLESLEGYEALAVLLCGRTWQTTGFGSHTADSRPGDPTPRRPRAPPATHPHRTGHNSPCPKHFSPRRSPLWDPTSSTAFRHMSS